ncbi:hypothetical protein COO60DRAFT_1233862 [Scenedesmus sp. NREL 46B-D3]|nr:hypothetical protein COO60DRAFT_1233862 [Scenedesmus sp. NREL 46B-D3]
MQRASGAAAAERLARQLHLEGQVEQMQAAWFEREQELVAQVEALRRDKAEAAALAAATAAGHDVVQWQADDALVAELRAQLEQQAADHAAQLHALQEKLAWCAESQALLGGADQLAAQQAQSIRQLQARLAAAEGAAGRGQAARITQLQEQVAALQEALASRRPSSVTALLAAAKPGPAEAAALAAAAATVQQLQVQLDQQQTSHEASLRQLQQQYEALKARLEQKSAAQQAAVGSKSRVRELTQQLEEQRGMYTRRIRALEARLTAAEGAAAAAGRRASASSSGGGGFRGGRGHAAAAAGGSRAAAFLRGSRQQGQGTAGARLARQGSSRAAAGGSNSGSEGGHALHDAAAAGSDGGQAQHGEGSAAAGAGCRPAVAAGLLRVRERQMAGLVAQLEERTSQFLQLQQKHRAAERQLKSLTAGQQQQSGGDSSEPGSPPARPDVAAAQDASPNQQQQRRRQQHAVGYASPQHRKRNGSGAAAAGGGAVPGAASWPALCAELEGEVEQLKGRLAEACRVADASKQQAVELSARLAEQSTQQQQQQPAAGSSPLQLDGLLPSAGSCLPPAPYLLSVAEAAAAREAARWEPQLAALQQVRLLRT